jgi:hypothetical protein
LTDESSLPISPRTLSVLRAALEESPLIVELRLGQRTEPERLFFYRYELLLDYLHRIARPGDTLTAWRFDATCTVDNAVVRASALQEAKAADIEGEERLRRVQAAPRRVDHD